MVSLEARQAPAAADAGAPGVPRIGPNAVVQTLRALAELEGATVADALRRRALPPQAALDGMIPEAWFVRLTDALRDALPWARSEAVLRLAGRYTADYVAAHRIPGAVRTLLRRLPPRLAVPILLAAFRRHAWTFAGGGRFGLDGGYPGAIVLAGCPTCRRGRRPAPAGGYYEAAFTGLLGLAAPGAVVREDACESRGAPSCRFTIHLGAHSPHGEAPCASS